MPLIQPPMLTHGGTHPARAMRMMIRDLARGSQGVTEANDLKVRQLSTPGSAVRVGDGSSIIRGASWGQGAYTQYNVGDAIIPIAPTGSTGRSDLVLHRIVDPEYEGNLDPRSDDIGFFHIIPNVGPTATTVPAGMTAIPLARIDIPPNTATITDAMIRDLRRIANPRRERRLHTAFPGSKQSLTYSDNRWRVWPTAARWTIPVPDWAVNVQAITTLAGLRMDSADVYATMQQHFGPIQGQDTVIDDDQGNNVRRSTVVLADSLGVTAAMRGTSQALYVQTLMWKSETGNLAVDGGTSLICDVEFNEGVI
ncbi:hypothetical protein ACFWF9_02710 [Streptomyces roseolus]|uniref:hypothetical protein n=1 Tax=Streptomyces roseolus TaxID=67358 RepID=UPI003665F84A